MNKKKEIRDDLVEIVKIINSLPNSSIIIVEGKTDKEILSKIIFKKLNIITLYQLHQMKPYENIESDILILTDFDEAGNEIHQRVIALLRSYGINEKQIRDDIRQIIKRILIPYGYSVYDGITSIMKKIGDIDFIWYAINSKSHLLYDDI